jgi:hypothetical protein
MDNSIDVGEFLCYLSLTINFLNFQPTNSEFCLQNEGFILKTRVGIYRIHVTWFDPANSYNRTLPYPAD